MIKRQGYIQRWEGEGGLLRSAVVQHELPKTLVFEHKEPADDDCGMPEHPIFANYTKYLWTSHRRSGGVQSQVRSRARTGTRTECEPLKVKPLA